MAKAKQTKFETNVGDPMRGKECMDSGGDNAEIEGVKKRGASGFKLSKRVGSKSKKGGSADKT